MNEEKKSERSIVVENKFVKWLDNYWYHYKWVTIGIAAALIVLVVCIAQACTREKKDIMIVYAGPNPISVSEQDQMGTLIGGVLPSDLDKNGESVAQFNTYQIFSEQQIREIEAKTGTTLDHNYNANLYRTYTSYLQTGESSIYFLDPWLYEELKRGDVLRPISELFSELPQGAIDEYGVRLGDTDLYKKYDLLKLLPEDTVICLTRPYVIGRNSNEETYQFEVDTFRAIVTYINEEE